MKNALSISCTLKLEISVHEDEMEGRKMESHASLSNLNKRRHHSRDGLAPVCPVVFLA
jgi:hypothetical protein